MNNGQKMKAFPLFLLSAMVMFGCTFAIAQKPFAARWKEVNIYLAKNTEEGTTDNPHSLYPVKRRVSARNALRATLVALTNGPTAAEERQDFINPTFGIKLLVAKIKAGVAYTYFTMPEGAAFSGDNSPFVFRDAVMKTASQFPGVRKVVVCLGGILDFWSESDAPPKKCPRV